MHAPVRHEGIDIHYEAALVKAKKMKTKGMGDGE